MKSFLKHIKKELHTYSFDYLLLITASIFFLVAIALTRGQSMIQFMIMVLYIGLYFIWSIIHHYHNRTLHIKVMLEYILISAIALFLLKIVLIH